MNTFRRWLYDKGYIEKDTGYIYQQGGELLHIRDASNKAIIGYMIEFLIDRRESNLLAWAFSNLNTFEEIFTYIEDQVRRYT